MYYPASMELCGAKIQQILLIDPRRRRPMTVVVAAIVCMAALGATGAARERGRPRDANAIDTIVIHTVGGPSCVGGTITFPQIPLSNDDAKDWQKLIRAAPVADSHFVVGRTGDVEPVIPLGEIANHTVGANKTSIGIELVNAGDSKETFPPAQIESLIALIKQMRKRYPLITTRNIVGHRDVDQRTCPCGDTVFRRRQDPGSLFPMSQVRSAVPGPPGTRSTIHVLRGPAPRSACTNE